jgi:hypothetical protein
MEYWLSNGQAPLLPALARQVVPFEPANLKVVEENGSFLVGDSRQILFNFGPHARDAQRALAIIRQYGFNELGLIGAPEPSMTYLLHNPNPRRRPASSAFLRPQLMPQMASRHALDLPGIGRVGERRFFDPMRLEIHKAGDGWHLMAGMQDLGLLGTGEYQARTAMQLAQRYPLTEQVSLSGGDFSFYLSHYQAPRGLPLGIRSTRFDPKTLTPQAKDGRWNLSVGKVTLASFSTPEAARQAAAVIAHFGFNCLCEPAGLFKYLAQDR